MQDPTRVAMTDVFNEKQKLPTTPPPLDSLFWKLWNSSKSIADKIMETDFLKSLNDGTLDPVRFGAFNNSNAYYCFRGTDCYEVAGQRAEDPTLKEFLVNKVEKYVAYNERFHTNWLIKDSSSVIPPTICKEYSDYELRIATQEDPIYTLVLMLPCEYLWAWISKCMLPVKSGNIYGDWIKKNDIPEDAFEMGNFLDLYLKANPNKIDEKKALEIYRTAMAYEYQYFLGATD